MEPKASTIADKTAPLDRYVAIVHDVPTMSAVEIPT